MNIFIDTTVLFNDPFFKNRFNKIILEYAKIQVVNLYISEVVLKEARNHYSNNIKDSISAYKKAQKNLQKMINYNIEGNINYDEDYYLEEFDKFYSQLQEENYIKVISYNNITLPVLVDRAIRRIKPFTEKKQEFRDCIIWLSYVDFVNSNDLDDCFLITFNTKDYLNKEGTELHDDLKKDCNKFKIYLNIEDLIKNEPSLFEIYAEIKVIKWVGDENISDEYVLKILESTLFDDVYSKVEDYVTNLEPYEVNHVFFEAGYVEMYGADIAELKNVEKEVFGNEIIITGEIKVSCETEVYQYNPVYEKGIDEKYFDAGSETMTIRGTFSFSYSIDRLAQGLEIDIWGKV